MSPELGVRDIEVPQYDFSGGVIGGISDLGLGRRALKHVRFADNAIFRPQRALSVRGGSRDIMNTTLLEPPHSLGKWYAASGNQVFAATNSGSSLGKLWRMVSTGPVQQTVPFTLTEQRIGFTMANAILVAAQENGSGMPFFFSATNAANTWLTMVLPKPAAAPTFGASSAGGSLTESKDYFYRVRWRYANGSSLSSPVSAAHQASAGNDTFLVQNLTPAAQGGTARSDWIGWTLERTKSNGASTGPFYLVKDGTTATTTDGVADADLFDLADETRHGEPIHYDGLIFHRDRLFGWAGSTLYLSQAIGDEEATGLCNWVADAAYFVAKDDGDTIQTVILQHDRLIIFKRHSVWAFEGDSPDSFRLRGPLHEGAGAAGTRCAAVSGGAVVFYSGSGGLFSLLGDKVRPLGWTEIGHYLDTVDQSRASQAVLKNYLSEFLFLAYPTDAAPYNAEVIAFDIRFNNWTHWTQWRIADALVQKDEIDFDRATLLFADPLPVVPATAGAVAANPGFIAWRDNRSATQVYAQSLSSLGAARWAANGIQQGSSTGSAQTLFTALAGDLVGGIVCGFFDNRSGAQIDLYAQRSDASGTKLWSPSTGVALDTSSHSGLGNLSACSDASNGAWFCWQSTRSSVVKTLVARLRGSDGAFQVGTDAATGLLVFSGSTNDDSVTAPILLPDGAGGCVVFARPLSGTTGLRGQRIDASGTRLWGSNGVQVASGPNSGFISACRDGQNGYWVCWKESLANVFVRRVNQDGTFATAAIRVNPAITETPTFSAIIGDQAGGCFVTWSSADAQDIVRVHQVSGSGTLNPAGPLTLYAATSTAIASLTAVQADTANAIVLWTPAGGSTSVRAQKLDPGLAKLWGSAGITVSALAARVTAASDGAGGALLAWTDILPGPTVPDIYAQRLSSTGAELWTAGGVPVAQVSGSEIAQVNIMTDTPVGEVPPGTAAGYHVWSAFKGFTDFADVNGASGQPIPWLCESPLRDEGVPQRFKELRQLHLFAETAGQQLTATLLLGDDGPPVSVPLFSSTAGNARYDDGVAKYDDGVTKFIAEGRVVLESGLPMGSLARRYALRVAGQLEDSMVVTGSIIDAQILPDFSYSEAP